MLRETRFMFTERRYHNKRSTTCSLYPDSPRNCTSLSAHYCSQAALGVLPVFPCTRLAIDDPSTIIVALSEHTETTICLILPYAHIVLRTPVTCTPRAVIGAYTMRSHCSNCNRDTVFTGHRPRCSLPVSVILHCLFFCVQRVSRCVKIILRAPPRRCGVRALF